MKIPITKPLFGPEEMAAVQRPLESGWVVQGPFVAQFEEAFRTYTGAKCAAASSTCTSALHLAVAALGLGPGDEVIVPAFTWVSTANVVEYMAATPVFCDVELDTFNLDVAHAESLVTERTVGIMPVHLFGLCADMAAVAALAQKHGLWVVEDAACGFGGRIRGQHAGTFGDLGCFSFHPRKSITTGEGGMVTSQRADLDELVRSLRDHGASRSDLARHTGKAGFLLPEFKRLGYNYRLTDLQAAVGCEQMKRADTILQARSHRARRYDAALADIDGLTPPVVPEGCVHGYQSYVCLFCPDEPSLGNLDALHARRNALMARLEDEGIATRQGTHAAALQRYYVDKYGLCRDRFPQAAIAQALSLTLPVYAQMTDEEQDYVVEHLRDAMHG